MKKEIIISVISALTTAVIIASFEKTTGAISNWYNSSPIPKGTIVLTAGTCNELGKNNEWEEFSEAIGRFPIGAGINQDKNGIEGKFILGHKDGEYAHKLTAPEIPSHSHLLPMDSVKPNSEQQSLTDSGGTDEGILNNNQRTSSVGGNGFHNNIPPYIAVTFCRKI